MPNSLAQGFEIGANLGNSVINNQRAYKQMAIEKQLREADQSLRDRQFALEGNSKKLELMQGARTNLKLGMISPEEYSQTVEDIQNLGNVQQQQQQAQQVQNAQQQAATQKVLSSSDGEYTHTYDTPNGKATIKAPIGQIAALHQVNPQLASKVAPLPTNDNNYPLTQLTNPISSKFDSGYANRVNTMRAPQPQGGTQSIAPIAPADDNVQQMANVAQSVSQDQAQVENPLSDYNTFNKSLTDDKGPVAGLFPRLQALQQAADNQGKSVVEKGAETPIPNFNSQTPIQDAFTKAASKSNADEQSVMMGDVPNNPFKEEDNIKFSPFGKSITDVDTLRDKLPTNLKPLADQFVESGLKHGVDPATLAAISMHETGNGTSKAFKEKQNAMGISPNNGGPMSFAGQGGAGASIDTMAQKLANSPVYAPARQAGNIQALGSIYAPIGAPNDPNGQNNDWTNGVSKAHAKLTDNQDSGTKKDVIDQQIKSYLGTLSPQSAQAVQNTLNSGRLTKQELLSSISGSNEIPYQMLPKPMQEAAGSLRKELAENKTVQKLFEVKDAMPFLDSLKQRTDKAGFVNNADSVTAIDKVLNLVTGSIPREAQYDQYMKSGNVSDDAKNLMNKLFDTKEADWKLTPRQFNDLYNSAASAWEAKQKAVQGVHEFYNSYADSYKIPRKYVTGQLSELLQDVPRGTNQVDHGEAYNWALANPRDPRAGKILNLIGAK